MVEFGEPDKRGKRSPGSDHRRSDEETARMADTAIIPIPGQSATPRAGVSGID